jgi:DNA-binding XRE family transcriptional regulator
LTQTEVADRLDVSTSTISAVERGKMLPGLPLLLKIGVAINTTASELVAALEENLDLN